MIEQLLQAIQDLNKVVTLINRALDLIVKRDGSSALKVWYKNGSFDFYEKCWILPRVGEHITKDNTVYVVEKVNYFIGTISYAEIWVQYMRPYKTGGLLE